MKLSLALLAAILLTPPCMATPVKNKTIKLDTSYTLKIEVAGGNNYGYGNGGVTTISISYGGDLVESISIGNSVFDDKNITFERICKGCGKSYVITLPDASSTYGAETTVIVYSGWSIAKLPSGLGVASTPKDGYFPIADDKYKYEFRDGVLIKAK